MIRWLVGFLLLLAIAAGLTYYFAGRGAPPVITINKPDRVVGQTGSIDVTVQAPNARLNELTIALEQDGKTVPLYALNGAEPLATVTTVDRDHLKITRPIGRQSVPGLKSGAAKIVVSATRPSILNLRTLSSSASKEFQVRLEPPRIAVLSSKHYVNHGGSEFVIYKVTTPDRGAGAPGGDNVASGVRVGEVEYSGFPIGADMMGAFFALLHDQDLNARIVAFARDEAGNESKATFVDNVFEKAFKKSRIELDDKFINRVVPDIIEHSPELKMSPPAEGSPDMLPAFVRVNSELRKINADEIAAFAKKTSAARLWTEPFVQLGNSKVEASFADHRTYFYNGKEVDRQTHLGFDLAVTEHVPVVAANEGVVLNASWLGIYGNCVILDHGMGVQSLYGHLMSFDVKVGDRVTRGQQIGRSDSTGLAGGDHLHFTMLVGGRMVNPVEWWDSHWISDRVNRKLAEAGVK